MNTKPNIAQAEPVAIGGAVLGLGNAVLGALPLFGVPLTAEQVGAANLVFVAVVALVTAIQRYMSTAKARVVEQTKTIEGKEVIVAGEANDILATGMKVRKLGERPDTPVAGIEKP